MTDWDDQTLLDSQRNAVFVAIAETGLEPAEFEWDVNPSTFSDELMASALAPQVFVSVLTHAPSGFTFQFDLKRNEHYAVFRPGTETSEERAFPGPWKGQLGYVGQWLLNVKREIEAPDLWSALSDQPVLSTSLTQIRVNDENSTFTGPELNQIHERLDQIEGYLENEGVLTEVISDSVSYLRDSARTQGRRDWRLMFLGVFLSALASNVLTVENFQVVVQLIAQSLRALPPG